MAAFHARANLLQIGKRFQLYAGLNAEMMKLDTAKGDFKLSLGDASRHLVERPSLALRLEGH